MKKVMIITLILVGALLIPAVSAEVLYDETIEYYQFTGGSGGANPTGTVYSGSASFTGLSFSKIEDQQDLSYIVIETEASTIHPQGVETFTYTLGGKTNNARMHVSYLRNAFGVHTATRYTLFFDDWDVYGLIGSTSVSTPIFYTSGSASAGNNHQKYGDSPVYVGYSGAYPRSSYKITCVSGINFKNHIRITDNADALVVTLNRVIDGVAFVSTLNVYDNSDNLIYTDTAVSDVIEYFLSRDVTKIEIVSVDREFIYPISSGASPSDLVTVYVRNAQTGALLADAHIIISASVNGNLHEVINETLPGGTAAYSLHPTGGGMSNPDFYHLTAFADGYNNIIPYIDFEHRGSTTLYIEMEPTSGGPVNENNTFVEFYVRDISANAVANAKVNLGGYMLWTNAQGYTQFEVPKNTSYPYIVTKTGYITIEGIATVGSDDRYIVNVALMTGTVPTQPTVTPTITVEPTQTTPPIQEDNIIGLSVKGLAKGFGIDYDTALLMFGLMIIFGAGGIVMSSVKGGAMEFIGGSIVGTFVAFALGLIPIWIFIIIAVVFGAYVLRVFVQGGQ